MRTAFFALLISLILIAALTVIDGRASAQTPVAAEDLPCVACHNDTTLIVSKQAQFHHSLHGSGEAYLRGTREDCAGCHGSEEAKRRISDGLAPHDASIQGVLNVSPYNCRTCHAIHTDYMLKDFSVTGDGHEVELEMTGSIFDGGAGNLCANCHQIRNVIPEGVGGQIEVASTRFGPHHGVEAQMLLGEGAIGMQSRPSVHYRQVGDTCVDCHMGQVSAADAGSPLEKVARNHTFKAEVSYCASCHEGIESFDYEFVQTDIQGLMDEVKAYLIDAGIMDGREDMANRSVRGMYSEEVAAAMWNYMLVLEDGSKGVHHPDWARRLLESARDALAAR